MFLETSPAPPKSSQPFALNLKTYPNEQIIKESKLTLIKIHNILNLYNKD